jgi:acyl-CoA synthetase (AMP-forming)/AMP-acid ligase II
MSLFDILAQRAAETPSSVYLVDSGGRWTFEEVHGAALKRSQWLKDRGVSLGSTVAVVAGRSVTTVETIFALLRLGANIVPLDHHEPAQRVSSLIEAADPAFVIGAAALQPSVTGDGRRAAWLDINETLPVNGGDTSRVDIPDDTIAFTFFTSGSTGRPKGIELSHKAIEAGQNWLQSAFRPGRADRQLFRTTLGVTNLVREIIWPVIGGFSAYILPDGATADVAAHVAAIDAGSVTIVGTVPILVDAMISARLSTRSLGSLRTIICTSDRFTTQQLRRLQAELPGARIYNIYGLTEALYIAAFDCASSAVIGDSVPVGLPAELRPLILNDNLERVGPPEVGRIYVSGTGLLTRYWNDPVLTDSRFVTIGDSRCFDTGDYGYVDDTGVMHLAGRSEFLIKIGGQRVDVFDLERAFTTIPGIAEACVVPVDIGGGVKRLAAFVVADNAEPVTEHDIRSALARSVPDYMLPSQLRFADKLPRLHNGKLDRQSLASRLVMSKASAPLASEGMASLEALVEALVGSVLNASRLDLTKTIVELGGDSISAFLISVRAFEMGVQIDPTVLISRPIADAISSAALVPAQPIVPKPGRSGQIEHLSDYGWSADEIEIVRARLAAIEI